jgi:uncharacterized protein (TIGR04255 family)
MLLQKKINPDYLKDTLVEIRYAHGIVQELALGYMAIILEPLGYRYLPAPDPNNVSENGNPQVVFGGGIVPGGFFVKDDVRIQVNAGQIIFNCMADKYVGWSKYFQIICDTVEKLFERKVAGGFNRVNVRYISEFKNIDIYQGIKGAIDISGTGLKLDNSILRLADESGSFKTYVTLTNKAKRISQSLQGQQIIEASLVDVNVYENFNPVTDLNILFNKLNQIHAKQKEIFFGLINNDFLNTLNPEY